jgi:hypothetical protein
MYGIGDWALVQLQLPERNFAFGSKDLGISNRVGGHGIGYWPLVQLQLPEQNFAFGSKARTGWAGVAY